ncbi:Coiled-coil domain-containing protein 162 like protein, partial [Aduncisulcus paluster]
QKMSFSKSSSKSLGHALSSAPLDGVAGSNPTASSDHPSHQDSSSSSALLPPVPPSLPPSPSAIDRESVILVSLIRDGTLALRGNLEEGQDLGLDMKPGSDHSKAPKISDTTAVGADFFDVSVATSFFQVLMHNINMLINTHHSRTHIHTLSHEIQPRSLTREARREMRARDFQEKLHSLERDERDGDPLQIGDTTEGEDRLGVVVDDGGDIAFNGILGGGVSDASGRGEKGDKLRVKKKATPRVEGSARSSSRASGTSSRMSGTSSRMSGGFASSSVASLTSLYMLRILKLISARHKMVAILNSIMSIFRSVCLSLYGRKSLNGVICIPDVLSLSNDLYLEREKVRGAERLHVKNLSGDANEDDSSSHAAAGSSISYTAPSHPGILLKVNGQDDNNDRATVRDKEGNGIEMKQQDVRNPLVSVVNMKEFLHENKEENPSISMAGLGASSAAKQPDDSSSISPASLFSQEKSILKSEVPSSVFSLPLLFEPYIKSDPHTEVCVVDSDGTRLLLDSTLVELDKIDRFHILLMSHFIQTYEIVVCRKGAEAVQWMERNIIHEEDVEEGKDGKWRRVDRLKMYEDVCESELCLLRAKRQVVHALYEAFKHTTQTHQASRFVSQMYDVINCRPNITLPTPGSPLFDSQDTEKEYHSNSTTKSGEPSVSADGTNLLDVFHGSISLSGVLSIPYLRSSYAITTVTLEMMGRCVRESLAACVRREVSLLRWGEKGEGGRKNIKLIKQSAIDGGETVHERKLKEGKHDNGTGAVPVTGHGTDKGLFYPFPLFKSLIPHLILISHGTPIGLGDVHESVGCTCEIIDAIEAAVDVVLRYMGWGEYGGLLGKELHEKTMEQERAESRAASRGGYGSSPSTTPSSSRASSRGSIFSSRMKRRNRENDNVPPLLPSSSTVASVRCALYTFFLERLREEVFKEEKQLKDPAASHVFDNPMNPFLLSHSCVDALVRDELDMLDHKDKYSIQPHVDMRLAREGEFPASCEDMDIASIVRMALFDRWGGEPHDTLPLPMRVWVNGINMCLCYRRYTNTQFHSSLLWSICVKQLSEFGYEEYLPSFIQHTLDRKQQSLVSEVSPSTTNVLNNQLTATSAALTSSLPPAVTAIIPSSESHIHSLTYTNLNRLSALLLPEPIIRLSEGAPQPISLTLCSPTLLHLLSALFVEETVVSALIGYVRVHGCVLRAVSTAEVEKENKVMEEMGMEVVRRKALEILGKDQTFLTLKALFKAKESVGGMSELEKVRKMVMNVTDSFETKGSDENIPSLSSVDDYTLALAMSNVARRDPSFKLSRSRLLSRYGKCIYDVKKPFIEGKRLFLNQMSHLIAHNRHQDPASFGGLVTEDIVRCMVCGGYVQCFIPKIRELFLRLQTVRAVRSLRAFLGGKRHVFECVNESDLEAPKEHIANEMSQTPVRVDGCIINPFQIPTEYAVLIFGRDVAHILDSLLSLCRSDLEAPKEHIANEMSQTPVRVDGCIINPFQIPTEYAVLIFGRDVAHILDSLLSLCRVCSIMHDIYVLCGCLCAIDYGKMQQLAICLSMKKKIRVLSNTVVKVPQEEVIPMMRKLKGDFLSNIVGIGECCLLSCRGLFIRERIRKNRFPHPEETVDIGSDDWPYDTEHMRSLKLSREEDNRKRAERANAIGITTTSSKHREEVEQCVNLKIVADSDYQFEYPFTIMNDTQLHQSSSIFSSLLHTQRHTSDHLYLDTLQRIDALFAVIESSCGIQLRSPHPADLWDSIESESLRSQEIEELCVFPIDPCIPTSMMPSMSLLHPLSASLPSNKKSVKAGNGKSLRHSIVPHLASVPDYSSAHGMYSTRPQLASVFCPCNSMIWNGKAERKDSIKPYLDLENEQKFKVYLDHVEQPSVFSYSDDVQNACFTNSIPNPSHLSLSLCESGFESSCMRDIYQGSTMIYNLLLPIASIPLYVCELIRGGGVEVGNSLFAKKIEEIWMCEAREQEEEAVLAEKRRRERKRDGIESIEEEEEEEEGDKTHGKKNGDKEEDSKEISEDNGSSSAKIYPTIGTSEKKSSIFSMVKRQGITEAHKQSIGAIVARSLVQRRWCESFIAFHRLSPIPLQQMKALENATPKISVCNLSASSSLTYSSGILDSLDSCCYVGRVTQGFENSVAGDMCYLPFTRLIIPPTSTFPHQSSVNSMSEMIWDELRDLCESESGYLSILAVLEREMKGIGMSMMLCSKERRMCQLWNKEIEKLRVEEEQEEDKMKRSSIDKRNEWMIKKREEEFRRAREARLLKILIKIAENERRIEEEMKFDDESGQLVKKKLSTIHVPLLHSKIDTDRVVYDLLAMPHMDEPQNIDGNFYRNKHIVSHSKFRILKNSGFVRDTLYYLCCLKHISAHISQGRKRLSSSRISSTKLWVERDVHSRLQRAISLCQCPLPQDQRDELNTILKVPPLRNLLFNILSRSVSTHGSRLWEGGVEMMGKRVIGDENEEERQGYLVNKLHVNSVLSTFWREIGEWYGNNGVAKMDLQDRTLRACVSRLYEMKDMCNRLIWEEGEQKNIVSTSIEAYKSTQAYRLLTQNIALRKLSESLAYVLRNYLSIAQQSAHCAHSSLLRASEEKVVRVSLQGREQRLSVGEEAIERSVGVMLAKYEHFLTDSKLTEGAKTLLRHKRELQRAVFSSQIDRFDFMKIIAKLRGLFDIHHIGLQYTFTHASLILERRKKALEDDIDHVSCLLSTIEDEVRKRLLETETEVTKLEQISSKLTEELKVRELSKVELMEKKSGKEKKLEMLENKLKKLRRWSKVDVDQLFGELEDGEKRAETLGREIQSLYTRINSIRHSVEKEEEASKRKIREERKVLRAASAASDKLRKTLVEGDSDEKDTQKRIEMVDMTMSAFGAAP